MHSDRPAIIAIQNVDGRQTLSAGRRLPSEVQNFSDRSYVLSDHLTNFEGRMVDEVDGAIVAWFPKIASAVQCAAHIQRQLKRCASTTQLPASSAPKIGIADVDANGDDSSPSEADFNLAIRMMQTAEPGGLCLSRTAYDNVRFSIKLPFDDRADPAHTAYQCGEIRKKFHSMDLTDMSAVKVPATAFNASIAQAFVVRPGLISGVRSLVRKISQRLGFDADRVDSDNRPAG